MAVEKLIVDHIDTWTTALQTRSSAGRGSSGKIDLYGIKKLRELILELAVRGKLVPQDPNDEPASELLKRIAAEKAELVKLGKIKKQKPLPEISEEEKPFELPIGWEWVRLGDLGFTQTGGTPSKSKPEYFGKDIPFIKPANITSQGVDYQDEGLTIQGANELGRLAPAGSVLMVCIGTIGKCQVVNRPCTFNQQINSVTPFIENSEFIFLCLSSAYFQSLAWSKSSSTTIAILNKGKWESLLLPLPPLEEQLKLIKTVKKLTSLCDQLEQHSLTSLDAHQQLVETLLTTLTDSQNANELAENWARISEHFDTLFITEASIDALKQTILQLAVMGKLVPQDPNDEPASELLKRIAQEKAQLVKDGKIKKQKPLPPISDEEKPFELPEGWEWSRLDHVASKITDGDHKTPPRIAEGYKLLSAKNIRDGFLDYENCDYISESSYIKSRERCLPEKGDLLIVSVGGTIGRSSLITGDSEFALVRSVAIIKPLIIEPNFLKIAMDSQLLQSMIHSHKRGGAQPCLYLGEISKFLFPVPPLKEQKRIVKTVDIFMGILETLTLAFQSAQQTQLHLADALTDAAIN
ncbi:restriction endonuclease subunit S [Salmonella enterica subsp. enterica serovar Ituri]|uniref:Restriction endonuclease subunit S n=2 Tax=Salmonella enterica TaxID=28901 RepID=A0A750HV17_SALER|nr:restriction endonuclease subunit S [Salmonella enterica]EAQ4212677.1 restriction endonuclease subunit S [Salmonella enterica subsp. enterica serovar Limete]EBF8301797.1 restriction endonuclease subunit S [Salmonella enterica subsp. enterica serovar Mbandaka]EBS0339464.1 restriction endonuclease subunit S [Salmonella enterica subsp. enterica serovar Ituri]ECH9699199.1 restriction endonuclease subunit S [Salmonella enterica subsp. enterica]EED7750625.1 restriction endonuclease subunit S [Salm